MNLGGLRYKEGSRKRRKRVGRGEGSGHGGTSCRGHKGYRSRSGSSRRAWYEGGQMPLQRRVPKRGFTNIFKKEYQIVNLKDLELIKEKIIEPDLLMKRGLIKKKDLPVKILGEGNLNYPAEIRANAFSRSAIEKIESAGGKAVIV
ncbi:MAG: 50S ribosomal protein L15 [Fidelibacterota bacterium]